MMSSAPGLSRSSLPKPQSFWVTTSRSYGRSVVSVRVSSTMNRLRLPRNFRFYHKWPLFCNFRFRWRESAVMARVVSEGSATVAVGRVHPVDELGWGQGTCIYFLAPNIDARGSAFLGAVDLIVLLPAGFCMPFLTTAIICRRSVIAFITSASTIGWCTSDSIAKVR